LPYPVRTSFAGNGQYANGVFLSTDNGISWTAVDSGLTNTAVFSLAVIPGGIRATNIFAGTQNGGVFSLNEQWHKLESAEQPVV